MNEKGSNHQKLKRNNSHLIQNRAVDMLFAGICDYHAVRVFAGQITARSRK